MINFRDLENFLQTNSIQTLIRYLIEDDIVTTLIRSALKQSAHILNNDKSALAYQLAGRLSYHQDKIPEIKQFLAGINPPQYTLYPLQGDFDALMPASNLIEWILPHEGWIKGFKQLADGRFISWSHINPAYSTSSSTEVKSIIYLWDKHGIIHTTIKKHPSYISDILQLENSLFLTWSTDKIIRLWDEQGNLINSFENHTDSISNIIMLSDGNFVSCSKDTTMCLWDKNGNLIGRFAGHNGIVNDVVELKNGKLLSWSIEETKNADQTLRIWGKNGVLHLTINDIKGVIRLKTGHIFSWSDDNTWQLWDHDGNSTNILNQQGYQILSASPLEHGGFVTYLADGSIHVWDKHGNYQVTLSLKIPDLITFKFHFRIRILMNNRFVTWLESPTLQLWDTNGILIKDLDGHQDNILGAKILSDGCILSWSGDRTVESVDVSLCLWDSDGNLLKTYYVHSDNIRDVLELDDNHFISCGEDSRICLWNRNGDIIPYRRPHRVGVCILAPLDNQYFFSSSYDSMIIWDANLEIVEKTSTQRDIADFITSHNRIGDFETLYEQQFVLDMPPQTLLNQWQVSANYNTLIVTDLETQQIIHQFCLDGQISRFLVVDSWVIVGDWLGRVVFLQWVK